MSFFLKSSLAGFLGGLEAGQEPLMCIRCRQTEKVRIYFKGHYVWESKDCCAEAVQTVVGVVHCLKCDPGPNLSRFNGPLDRDELLEVVSVPI